MVVCSQTRCKCNLVWCPCNSNNNSSLWVSMDTPTSLPCSASLPLTRCSSSSLISSNNSSRWCSHPTNNNSSNSRRQWWTIMLTFLLSVWPWMGKAWCQTNLLLRIRTTLTVPKENNLRWLPLKPQTKRTTSRSPSWTLTQSCRSHHSHSNLRAMTCNLTTMGSNLSLEKMVHRALTTSWTTKEAMVRATAAKMMTRLETRTLLETSRKMPLVVVFDSARSLKKTRLVLTLRLMQNLKLRRRQALPWKTFWAKAQLSTKELDTFRLIDFEKH